MPAVYPFRAVQYSEAIEGGDVSHLVAPPYDVLDAEGKARLLAKDPRNVVGIDLPHLPAKSLGPPEVYARAGDTYRSWLAGGELVRAERPAMFVYRETFEFRAGRHRRTGMCCTIETLPFGARAGGGVLPHEETFSGPKEDRFALMTATAAQLSPIFGLHADERGEAAALLSRICGSAPPAFTARTDEGVLHEVWRVEDAPTISAYQAALRGEDVFIADGHHRYTTGLNYLARLEQAGTVPAEHPARRCMFVLVSMSDPGMVIGPTHRVLGGMSGYSYDRFAEASAGLLELTPAGHGEQGLAALEDAMEKRARAAGRSVLGVYDFATGTCALASPRDPDPLKVRFPAKVPAWRTLDVALVQYVVVEQICQPALNGGQPVQWAFPHSIDEVRDIGAGKERGSGGGKSFTPQVALIVRPTPLEAVRAVSRAGELMPQKSTFFYPKLATGLFINPLE